MARILIKINLKGKLNECETNPIDLPVHPSKWQLPQLVENPQRSVKASRCDLGADCKAMRQTQK